MANQDTMRTKELFHCQRNDSRNAHCQVQSASTRSTGMFHPRRTHPVDIGWGRCGGVWEHFSLDTGPAVIETTDGKTVLLQDLSFHDPTPMLPDDEQVCMARDDTLTDDVQPTNLRL